MTLKTLKLSVYMLRVLSCNLFSLLLSTRSLSQVEYLHDRYGNVIFEERDEYGHSPAHWMALNGHVAIARYMVQKKAKVDLHSDNGQGPRPIHWASRNGHVAVVDELLSVSRFPGEKIFQYFCAVSFLTEKSTQRINFYIFYFLI